jgi:TIGR03009 family protein
VPTGGAPPAAPADPKLDAHLKGWEQKMGGVINFWAEIEMVRTDAVFKKDRKYGGGGTSVLCMKPNFARLRLVNAADPKDFEAFICNGKFVYHYEGLTATVTEYPIAANAAAGASDNLMLDFLSGMKAGDVKKRFEISLFKEDEHYVYLDVKPVLGKDKQEFLQLRFALYGPATKFAYLPAQVWLMKPNGDTELWSFKNPQTGIPGIGADKFQYEEVKGFTFKKAGAAPPAPPGPGQPPMPPGGTGLPPGPGAVKKQ